MNDRTAGLTDAIDMANAAATAAMGYFRGSLGVEFKADESPVTQADRGVETVVRHIIAERFPDHGIFGEEHGIEGEAREAMWVIDPIDGTRSFISGNPLFGFLLAHVVGGETRLGVVGMPALGEVYTAELGKGAKRGDGKQLATSGRETLDGAILYINEAEKIWRARPEVFSRLMAAGQTRRFAYDCYPYALLASGHVDAVIDFDLQPYDYLPVALLVAEAGGVMSDWQGAPLRSGSDVAVIAAATPALHARLLGLVAS